MRKQDGDVAETAAAPVPPAADEYGLYKTPSLATIAAYFSVAATLFFGAYLWNLRTTFFHDQNVDHDFRQDSEIYIKRLEREQEELKTQLQALRNARHTVSLVPASVPEAPASSTVDAQPEVTDAAQETAALAIPVADASVGVAVREVPDVMDGPGVLSMAEDLPELEVAASMNPAEDSTLAEPSTLTAGDVLEMPSAVEVGEVLAYNPDTQSVMLSVGATDTRLEKGKRFTLWRDETYLGEVRVERVFSTMSACKVWTDLPHGLRVGDSARTPPAGASVL